MMRQRQSGLLGVENAATCMVGPPTSYPRRRHRPRGFPPRPRPPPPPPPPLFPPPPPLRDPPPLRPPTEPEGFASSTFSVRPSTSCPLNFFTASAASSAVGISKIGRGHV